MAGFTPGFVFAEHEVMSPAKLHALVEGGSLNNVNQADLAAGIRLVNLTTPVSSITGDLLVGSDFLLDYYDGAAYSTPMESDLTTTLRNDEAFVTILGDPVMLTAGDPTGFKRIVTTNDAARPFGVVTVAGVLPAATTPIQTRGLVQVRVFDTWTRGDLIVPSGLPAGYCYAVTAHGYSNGFAKAWDTGGTAGLVSLATVFLGK